MRQFEDWRFTKGACDPPQEYLDYLLCAHVYHCTPLELDEQPAQAVNLHLAFFDKENAKKSGKPKPKPKPKLMQS
jgi:hypothetical protein